MVEDVLDVKWCEFLVKEDRLYHNNKQKLFDRSVDCRNDVISKIKTLMCSREFLHCKFVFITKMNKIIVCFI